MCPLFRAAWQITTKPYATFPAPPLKFRTAGFPQYGYKAGLSDGAFLHNAARTVCVRPSRSPWRHRFSALCRSYPFGGAPPFKRPSSLYPRGPRSGAGYAVLHPQRLFGLIRPTCRHIETSPHSGLYPMPSLSAVRPGRRVVPCFHCAFLLDMPSSQTPESSPVILTQFIHRRHWPSPRGKRLGALDNPHHPLPVGTNFEASLVHISLRPVELLASLADRTGSPQPQRRLRPGFQRVGHPPRCRI
jgi:hypothetical protein